MLDALKGNSIDRSDDVISYFSFFSLEKIGALEPRRALCTKRGKILSTVNNDKRGIFFFLLLLFDGNPRGASLTSRTHAHV